MSGVVRQTVSFGMPARALFGDGWRRYYWKPWRAYLRRLKGR